MTEPTYTEQLWKVMCKEKQLFHPIMIFVNGMYIFNGIEYSSQELANDARRKYYNN